MEKEISKHPAKTFSRVGIHGNKWNHLELEGSLPVGDCGLLLGPLHFISLKMELPVEFLGQQKIQERHGDLTR